MEINPELTTTESEKKDAETESENEDSTAVSMENKEDFTPVFEVDSGDFYAETEVENKYFTMENKEDVTAVFEADSDYNLDLWRALVGNRSSLPKKDDLVVYFPQGHLEYAALITSSSFSSSEVPTFNLQPEIICSVQHVQLIANKMTDETCAHVILLPEQKLEGQNTKDEEVMKSGVNKARDRGRPEKAASQVFSVTLSKPKHLQTIWIPEYAYEVFPLRNFRFRTQLVSAEDVQGTEWMFCIKYADSRRKYQIRRGWTQFVTTKRLSLKDTVAFVRCGDRKLRLVIKRFGCECGVPMSILAKYYQCSSVLSPVADAILKGSPFNVFYCGRVGSADFIIPYQKYMESITRLGMIGAKFETMDALSQRCSGVVTGISELDPFNWPNSKWKCLMVSWDNAANKKPLKEAVSPWEIVLKVPSSSDSSIDISPKLKEPRTVRLLNISLPLHDPAGSGSVLFDDKLKEREKQASVMGLEGFQRKINHVIDIIEQAPAPQTAFPKALSSDKLQRNSSPKAWEKLNTSLYDPAGSSFVLFDDKLEERGKQASGMVQEEFQQKEFPLKRIVDIIKQGLAPQTAFSEALSSDKLQWNSRSRAWKKLNTSFYDPAESSFVLFDDKLEEREKQASAMVQEEFQQKEFPLKRIVDIIKQGPAPQTAFSEALSSDKLQRNSRSRAWKKLNTSFYDPAGSSVVLFDDKLEEKEKQASAMVQEEFQRKEFPLKRIVDIIKQGPAPQTAFSEALSSDKLQRNSRSRAWKKLNTSFYDPAGSSFVLFDDKLEEREKQASVMVQEEFQRKEFPLKRIIDIIKQGRAPQIAFPKALSSDELQRNSRPRARKKRSGFDTDRDSSLASSKKRKSATIVTPTHLKISKRPDQELMICFERGVSRATHDKVSVDRLKPLQMQFSHAPQICESTAPFPDKGDVSSSIMTQPSSRLKRQRKLDSSPVDIETEGFLDELKSLEMQSPESKQVLPSTTPFPGKGDVSSSIMAQPSSRLKKELENSPLDSFRFTPLPGNCCLASLSESKSTTDVKQLKISNCSGHDVWFHLKGDHCFEYLEFDSCSFPSYTSLHIPIILKELKITNCLVTECVFTSLMDPKVSVESLEIDSCSSLHSISIDNIPASLRQLKIVNCMNLKSLSESIFESSKHHSVSLGPLNYSDLSKIDSIGTLELRKLVIQNCLELEYLPEDLHKLCNLDVLSIKNCCSLEYFPEGGLPKTCLRSLKISECENLKRLPNQLEEVTSLQKLSICGCSSLVSFQEGGLPPNLVSLRIINCENLFLDLSQWDLDKLKHLKLCSFIGGCPDS